jgi:hypothetical protein
VRNLSVSVDFSTVAEKIDSAMHVNYLNCGKSKHIEKTTNQLQCKSFAQNALQDLSEIVILYREDPVIQTESSCRS